jgi:thiamine-phosphate pyrophosphorylase
LTHFDFSVYLVTDTRLCGGPAGVLDTVRRAVAGGVTAVQVRDPLASTRELVELSRAVLGVLRGSGVPLIVNDRADVALAVGADGLHVGQRDLDPVSARRLIGPTMHLGLSVSTPGDLTAASDLPVGTLDLLGVGPIRDTPSKVDASSAMGFDGLARICRDSPLPCVGIGGLQLEDVTALKSAGAVGMAVISAICGRPDPEAATRELVSAWASTSEPA